MIIEVFKCKNCGWRGSPEEVFYNRSLDSVRCPSCKCDLMQYRIDDVKESIDARRSKTKPDPRYLIDKPY